MKIDKKCDLEMGWSAGSRASSGAGSIVSLIVRTCSHAFMQSFIHALYINDRLKIRNRFVEIYLMFADSNFFADLINFSRK